MLYDLPYEHSIIDAREGDPALISRRLLDVIDRHPPLSGTLSVMYLIFNPSDEQHLWFSSATAAGVICEQMFETFQRESDLLKSYSLETYPALAWRFQLLQTAKPSVLQLEGDPSASAKPTMVEIVFRDLSGSVARGTLHVVMRSGRVLHDGARLLAVVSATSPLVHVATHLDRFQRGLRWSRPEIYLTEQWNQFTVGPHPACDLVCESLERFWTVSFQEKGACWEVTETRGGAGESVAEKRFSPDLFLKDENTGVCVEGRVLSRLTTFETQLKKNRLPIYDLTVVSRLLPLGPSSGYGYVADELNRRLEDAIRSSVRLSADGSFLYVNDSEQLFSIDYGAATPRPIESGDTVAVGDLSMTWQPFVEGNGENLSDYFYGQLVFENPITRRLASSAINVSLWEAFVAHYDELQGRARLVSPDGLNFLVCFPEGVMPVPVWIKKDKENGFQLHTEVEAEWKVDNSTVEFVVGSTRFILTAAQEHSV